MSKETIIKEGKLVLNRHEISQEFFCQRCQNNKKAKVTVDWHTLIGEKKVICNGCYGYLLSQQK